MNYKYFLGLFFIALILWPVTAFTQEVSDKEPAIHSLDGVFSGGGGNYYIRQLGNEILWYGEEDALSPTWSNVGHGIIKGNIIKVKWADVPKGSIMQSGSLVIRIESNDELVLLEQEGEFFATDTWIRTP